MKEQQIGDGKFPNKYWVSWNNDYYILQDHTLDWASEIEGFEVKGGISKPFKTYREAMNFFEDLDLIFPKVTAKFIEDRLTGELTSEVMTKKVKITFEPEIYEDLSFTKDKMEERGETFE